MVRCAMRCLLFCYSPIARITLVRRFLREQVTRDCSRCCLSPFMDAETSALWRVSDSPAARHDLGCSKDHPENQRRQSAEVAPALRRACRLLPVAGGDAKAAANTGPTVIPEDFTVDKARTWTCLQTLDSPRTRRYPGCALHWLCSLARIVTYSLFLPSSEPRACTMPHLFADEVLEFNKWRGFGHIAMDQKDWCPCACHAQCQ